MQRCGDVKLHDRGCVLLIAMDTKLRTHANSVGNPDRESGRYEGEGVCTGHGANKGRAVGLVRGDQCRRSTYSVDSNLKEKF